jgi:GTP-binding protein
VKRCPFTQARFVKTAIEPKDYPILKDSKGHIKPEIATAGRSNVGKSSLLNHLFQSKSLVKTSSTPGKTQALNFFTVNEELAFVDLPGYGYASVSKQVKAQWGPMVQKYLGNREPLQLILFLIDIRRIPNEDDLQFLEWVVRNNKAMILVITKIDKVKANECVKFTKRILDTLAVENLHYVHYSVTQNKGRDRLITLIHEALEDEMSQDGEGADGPAR